MAWFDEDTYDPGGGQIPEGPSGGSGFDWASGLTNAGSLLLRGALPGIISNLAGMGINRMLPGQPAGQRNQLMDTRTAEQKGAAGIGLSSLQSLTQNPNSFGLPGDPGDINTPAGRKMWDIRNSSRSADAARGMSTTGGSAQRETDAVNRAQAGAYQQAYQNYAQTAGAGYPQHLNQQQIQPNPWAKLFAGGVDPAIQSGVRQLLDRWGLGE